MSKKDTQSSQLHASLVLLPDNPQASPQPLPQIILPSKFDGKHHWSSLIHYRVAFQSLSPLKICNLLPKNEAIKTANDSMESVISQAFAH